jgi:hypothetical protein
MLCLSIPPFAIESLRPKLNSDFEALQVKDDPTASAVAAVRTLEKYGNPFWGAQLNRLAAQKQGLPPDVVDEIRRRMRRSLLFDASADGGSPLGSVAGEHTEVGRLGGEFFTTGSGRQLRDKSVDQGGGGTVRKTKTRLLNLFYRYADNSTAITDSLVEFVRLPSSLPCALCARDRIPPSLRSSALPCCTYPVSRHLQ